MSDSQQNYANHARYVPGFHFATIGLLLVNLVWRAVLAWQLFRAGDAGPRLGLSQALADLVLAFALLLLVWYTRAFPMRVQDRVIRAEERERLGRLLPPELRGRVGELQPRQLIALRFASDEEVPALAGKVIEQRITDAKAIKQMIRSWRADHLRA
jgi:hypothetical protein